MVKWDLYDFNLEKTNKTIDSNLEVPDGYYHMAVEIWIINSKKEVFLLKRSLNYSGRYPGLWSCLGNSMISGENVNQAINRIIKDNIGLDNYEYKLKILKPKKRDPYKYAYITCFVLEDINIHDIKVDDSQFISAKFVDDKELVNMCNNGEIAYYLISRIENDVLPFLKQL